MSGFWLATAFDIDGVLAHTDYTMVEVANNVFGLNLELEKWIRFKMEESFGLPKEMVRKIIDISLSRENANKIPINEEGVTTLEELSKELNITIPLITSRKKFEDTEYFLDNYVVRGRFDYVLRTKIEGYTTPEQKVENMIDLYCTALVDDGPENCKEIKNTKVYNLISIMYSARYNQHVDKSYYTVKTNNWKEIKNLVITIEELLRGC